MRQEVAHISNRIKSGVDMLLSMFPFQKESRLSTYGIKKPVVVFCFNIVVLILGSFILLTYTAVAQDIGKNLEMFYSIRIEDNVVEIINGKSGRVQSAFSVPGEIVRLVMLVDEGQTLVVCQLSKSTLWVISSKRKIMQISGCIHGFNHTRDMFLRESIQTPGEILIQRYPEFETTLKWVHPNGYGIAKHLFSPDDCYLAIQFNSNCPLSDEFFTKEDLVFKKNIDEVYLFELTTFQPLAVYSPCQGETLGKFSEDSNHYKSDRENQKEKIFDLMRRRWAFEKQSLD